MNVEVVVLGPVPRAGWAVYASSEGITRWSSSASPPEGRRNQRSDRELPRLFRPPLRLDLTQRRSCSSKFGGRDLQRPRGLSFLGLRWRRPAATDARDGQRVRARLVVLAPAPTTAACRRRAERSRASASITQPLISRPQASGEDVVVVGGGNRPGRPCQLPPTAAASTWWCVGH